MQRVSGYTYNHLENHQLTTLAHNEPEMVEATLQRVKQINVFTFGGAKRSGSDRECKYFPIGMNAREPLWR